MGFICATETGNQYLVEKFFSIFYFKKKNLIIILGIEFEIFTGKDQPKI